MASQHPDIEKVLFTQEDIDGIVSRLGEQITRDYAGKDLVLIAVLRGAVVFMGDLMRKIELPTNIDFMAVSSYGDGVKSSGIVRIIKDLDIDIRGRDVLIVEDILDSGGARGEGPRQLYRGLPRCPLRGNAGGNRAPRRRPPRATT